MVKTNFHAHTTFCDGKNTPEEMISWAIDKNFTALGFSSHSYIPGDSSWTLNPQSTLEYFSTINRLKDKYADKIKIFCGIEQDILSPKFNLPFDYVIGSVHAVCVNGKNVSVDNKQEMVKDLVNEVFNGKFEKLAKEYFCLMERVIDLTQPDIIGHIDVVSKFSERLGYVETEEYLEYAYNAVNKLAKFGLPFEINTGGMARGYKSEPYPSKNILKMVKQVGGNICLSSDCHVKEKLDFWLDEGEVLAKEIGFTQRAEITDKGIKYVKI